MASTEHAGAGLFATEAGVLSDQLKARLAQETFDRILFILQQLGLHRRSPKFFIIYAHENDELDIRANANVVKDYISWFKKTLFNVDSDKSPHGYGAVNHSAHAGASVDILKNQMCLLPRTLHENNVDYVLVFYSELLARYMEDERNFKVRNQSYSEALFDACNSCTTESKSPLDKVWNKVFEAVTRVQRQYSTEMGGQFHHVLTELAFLSFRNDSINPNYTIPIILFDDQKFPDRKWRPESVRTNDTQIRLKLLPGGQHDLFFKILLTFETLENDRPLIEALRDCFQVTVNLLSGKAIKPEEYHTQLEVNISQALLHLNNTNQDWRMERPITKGGIRDILNLLSLVDRKSTRRVSGEKLPENLSDISLAVAARPGSEDEKIKGDKSVFVHTLFDEIVLEDNKKIAPQRIFILGRPGIGKTTLCRRIMYEYS